MKDQVITIADRDQVWNFRLGMPLGMTNSGVLVPMTWWQRRASAMREFALHWTRWLRRRDVCSAIDADQGCITLSSERWSWFRWRWERA